MNRTKAAEEVGQVLEKEVKALRARVRELERERGDESRQKWPMLSLHAIESLRDMVFWVRPDMTFEYVNESACRVLEYSRVELMRMTVADFDQHMGPEKWGPHWERLRREGYVKMEAVQRTKSGRLIPVEIMATFLTIDGQELSCAVVREISDRRKAEEALRESEARFRALFLNMAEGVALHRIVYDERGAAVNYEILDVNPKYEEILGVKREDVVGRTGTEVYGTSDPPYLTEFSSVASTGVPYVFETYFAPLDKHFQISTVSSGTGYFSTIFFDISTHKRMERALRERLLALTQPIGHAGTVRFSDYFNPDEIQSLQDAMARACFVSAVLIQPDGTLATRMSLPGRDAGVPLAWKKREHLAPGEVWPHERPLPVPNLKEPVFREEADGEPGDAAVGFWMEERHLATWLISAGVRRNGKQKGEGTDALQAAAQLFFLTAQRLALPALQNRQQAGMILQLEKTEERIRKLNIEWMGKNVELENILHVASHDLRSPLVNIIGFSEQIRKAAADVATTCRGLPLDESRARHLRDLLEERIPRSLTFIHAGATRMDQLIGGLLKFSRLGRMQMHLETVCTRRLVDQILQSMAFSLQKIGAVVQVDHLPDCYGDIGQLGQVFSNLIDNAIKYRHPQRTLRIRLFGRVEGQMITFGVEDNGIGIKAEHQPRVWELFHRLRPNDEVKGEGMGLTLVKRIVDRHRGRVFVESDGANGSTFFFMLPLTQEVAND